MSTESLWDLWDGVLKAEQRAKLAEDRLHDAMEHVSKLPDSWRLREDLLALLQGTGEDLLPGEEAD